MINFTKIVKNEINNGNYKIDNLINKIKAIMQWVFFLNNVMIILNKGQDILLITKQNNFNK